MDLGGYGRFYTMIQQERDVTGVYRPKQDQGDLYRAHRYLAYEWFQTAEAADGDDAR